MKQNLPNVCVNCNSIKPFYGLLDYYDMRNMPHCKECFKDKIEKLKEKYIIAANKADNMPIKLEKLVQKVLDGTNQNTFYIFDAGKKVKVEFYKYDCILLFIMSNDKAVVSLHLLEETLDRSNVPFYALHYSLLDKIVLLRNFND